MLLVEKDFQDQEVMEPLNALKEAGHDVVVAGGGEKTYKGKLGGTIDTDGHIKDYNASDFDAVVIPGGWAPDYMRRVPYFVAFVKEMSKQDKVIASICHGGWILASAEIINGKKLTSFMAIKDDLVHAGANYVDEEVVVDGKLITSRKPSDIPAFCREILKQLK